MAQTAQHEPIEPRLFLDGRVTLYGGDNRDILRQLPDNSIDAIVTDPPYALVSIQKRFGKPGSAPAKDVYARGAAGFMGKQWDTGEVAFSEEFWGECLRVLKPGGHVVAFSGTRTYHRMACAIEDAGFEIRDQLAWAYGCLDDQTMAVTPKGVIPYHKINIGDLVLSYDPSHMSYEWQPVEEVLVYDVDDTAYRISTDFGDQLVSRNHRCIVERGGEEVFEFAEEAARQYEIRVPVLEDLRALLDAVPNAHEGAGITQSNVFAGLHESDSVGGAGSGGEASGNAFGKNAGHVHGLRDGILAQHETSEKGVNPSVQPRVQRSATRAGLEGARTHGARQLDAGIGAGSGGAHDGRDEPIVERWGNVQKAEGQLRFGALRSVPGRAYADVAQGRVCDGAPPECGDGDWSPSHKDGMRAPHRPRSVEQHADKPDVIRDEQGPQAVRAWRGHKTVVGRITPERYRGVIWCVRVKTGAFVAVRNGFAFPTGNSGFPKSHDVSKAIDKAAGKTTKGEGRFFTLSGGKSNGGSKFRSDHPEYQPYAPATDAARQWQGWGTALKPAWEPICMARKPLEGTVAGNVLEHGTGALNIDGCRVGDEVRHASFTSLAPCSGNKLGSADTAEARRGTQGEAKEYVGRWPANIVHDGSEEVVSCFPDSKAGSEGADRGTGGIWSGVSNAPCGPQYGDSGSAARFFYSAKADKQDRIGSKHPTVKPVDLMQWLCRLVTPPGGTVLDPFAGSGSTGEAAWREGFKAILCEREPEYQEDIAERLRLSNAGPIERRVRAIKQSDSLGPLFGDNDNSRGGGGGRQIYGKFADQQPGWRNNGR